MIVETDEVGRKGRISNLEKNPGVWLKVAAMDPPDRDSIAALVEKFGFLTSFRGDRISAWEEFSPAIRSAFLTWAAMGGADRLSPEVRKRFDIGGSESPGGSDEIAEALNPLMLKYVKSYVCVDPRGKLMPAVAPTHDGFAGYALLEFLDFVGDPKQRARTCEVCGDLMTHKSDRARYCSERCKQAASRAARGLT